MIFLGMSPFLLLCATGLFAIFSSTISKSPVLPLYAAHLGADPSGVGFVAAVSAAAGIVFSVPAGMLSDRVGRKRMLMASLFVFATAPFLYPLVTGIRGLAAVRLYHGIATAIFVPVAMAMVADLFKTGRGERLGWFSSATLWGRFMAPAVGGSILGAMSGKISGTGGFMAVYMVCGAAGVLALLFAIRLPATERAHHRRTWAETASSFREVGLCLSSQVITLALAKPLMGRFSDRHGRRAQIAAGAAAASLAIAGFSMAGSLPAFIALSVGFGFCLSVVMSATAALVAELSPRDAYGSSMGLLGSVMDIGHTAGPIVAGLCAAALGYGAAFKAAGVVVLCFALIFGFSSARGRVAVLK